MENELRRDAKKGSDEWLLIKIMTFIIYQHFFAAFTPFANINLHNAEKMCEREEVKEIFGRRSTDSVTEALLRKDHTQA